MSVSAAASGTTYPAYELAQQANDSCSTIETFWINLFSRHCSLRPIISKVLALKPETVLTALENSVCNFHEFILAMSLGRRGRELLGEILSSLPDLERVVYLDKHMKDAHLSYAALNVKKLKDFIEFSECGRADDLLLYLKSVLNLFTPEESPENIISSESTFSYRKLELLSLNIWGLPTLYGYGSVDPWRYRQIATELKKSTYSVVALQEMWNRDAEVILQESGEWFIAAQSEKAKFLGQSGLVTMSRFPIVESQFLPFTDKSGLERVIVKGALYSRIEISPARYIDIYNVHLASEPERLNRLFVSPSQWRDILHRQLQELSTWITMREEPSIQTFILGDFNIDENQILYPVITSTIGSDIYRNRVGSVEEHPHDEEVRGITFDPDRNRYAKNVSNAPERLDYILARSSEQWSLAKRVERVFLDRHLSDHYGVATSLRILE